MEELYSSNLALYDGDIGNTHLQESLYEICEFLNVSEPAIYSWDEERIALSVNINVNLPSLGNHENIDIRSIEPILIVFNVKNYPSIAPVIFTDRISFPKDKLAHLYVAKIGKPPAFCLVRGNFSDWYAKKRPIDLLKRISNWFQDAATGELTLDGNQFDPLRLENYNGLLIYDYSTLSEVVNKNEEFSKDANFAILLFKRIVDKTYRFEKFITEENYAETILKVAIACDKNSKGVETDHYHIGYLVWSENLTSYNQYFVDPIQKWEELKISANSFGINLNLIEDYLSTKDVNYFLGVPIILAIRRSLKVIGFDSDIEFSNHVIILDNDNKKEGKIVDEVRVLQFSHNQILNQKKAKIISGESDIEIGKSLIIGCGALGSKIIMHFARSGQENLILVDSDKLSSHNLVRHSLLGEHVGMNKAEALVSTYKGIFPDQDINISAFPYDFSPLANFLIDDKYSWIFDFAASENVFNILVTSTKNNTRVCRAYLSDGGNLGLMFIEGEERNPRIDDLEIYLYGMSKDTDWISEWLKKENDGSIDKLSNISVGVGCNSETTILSDDTISSHAAYFSSVAKRKTTRDQIHGAIYVCNIIDNEVEYNIRTRTIIVPPVTIIPAANDPTWEIRFSEGITRMILEVTSNAGNDEIGGIFVGVVNYKSKTIHVVDLIDAPPDSTANELCFHRGYFGLSALIKEVAIKSGNQLGYVGEWHSHPNGPNCLSTTDFETVNKFKKEFNSLLTPLPVFLTIVTPEGILPYVFTS